MQLIFEKAKTQPAAIDLVMKLEGGVSYHELDTGGFTVFGITEKHNPAWPGFDIVRERIDAGLKYKDMEKDEQLLSAVRMFYESRYDANLPPPFICHPFGVPHFSFDVVAGKSAAVKAVQRALTGLDRAYHLGCQCIIDGICGQATTTELRKVLNGTEVPLFLEYWRHEISQHFNNICFRNVTQNVFLLGWENRMHQSFIAGLDLVYQQMDHKRDTISH